MKLLEKLLANTGELVAAPYLKAFNERSPEKMLKNSMQLLDADALRQVREYINNCFSESGGFKDRSGKADLYYTLFGCYLARTFDMAEIFPAMEKFVLQKISSESLSDVHLHCAAIISATTPTGWGYPVGVGVPRRGVKEYPDARVSFRSKVKHSIRRQLKQQKIYNAFLSLLTCYYIKDFSGIYLISKYLAGIELNSSMPCSVSAAGLVLQKTFHRSSKNCVQRVLSFYDNAGGFKATNETKASDLLSTAVALYALNFAGEDLRSIRPQCLNYIDSLFNNGGFSANHFDPDTDIEYTFYGLLALGVLAT